MTIITWNCAMALQKKLAAFESLKSDIAIIQECSKSAIELLGQDSTTSTAWFGDNKNKGLGVVTKSPWRITGSERLDAKWAALVSIDGPLRFDLLAIWACAVKTGSNYIGQVHTALDQIESRDLSKLKVIAGDFNSNSIWDGKRPRNHSLAVERMSQLGFLSAYHCFSGEEKGRETQNTLFLHRSSDVQKHYHIDYVFLAPEFLRSLKDVSIGSFKKWSGVGGLSDHAPLSIKLK